MIVRLRLRGSAIRPGFTLAELVVVLVILAATAALVIPRLGFMKSQSDAATSAAGAAQIVSNLETYKLTTGGYPMGMDSLTDGTALYSKLFTHSSGGPASGLSTALTAGTVGSTFAESFGHGFSPPSTGYYLYDHSETATDYTNSATVLRPFTSASSANVAIVTSPPTSSTGTNIIKAAGYPTGVLPAGVKLIAMGVGPGISSIGETMASAPRHSGQTADWYGRYIAIFAVYETSTPGQAKGAQLKAVVDSNGSPVDANIAAYKRNAPTKD